MSNTYALYGSKFENLEKKDDQKKSYKSRFSKSAMGVEVGGLVNRRIMHRQNSFVK